MSDEFKLRMHEREVTQGVVGFCKQTNATIHIQPDGTICIQTTTPRQVTTSNYDGDLAGAMVEHFRRVFD